jgi:hypothetical protein
MDIKEKYLASTAGQEKCDFGSFVLQWFSECDFRRGVQGKESFQVKGAK